MTTLADVRTRVAAPEAAVRLGVEYWTVAMEGQSSCGSCDATLAALSEAIVVVRPLAARLGIAVDVLPRTIVTWAQAVEHGIVASPTIRAACLEMRPSHREDSESRSWAWRGNTTPSATPQALLAFLVQALAMRSHQIDDYLASGGPHPYVRQFLQEAPPTASPTVEEQRAADCGCGPVSCG
jgi:hypothetical protein